jgi:ABC-2 type transport system permease protein
LAQKLAKAKKVDFRSYLSPDEIHKIIDLRSMGNPTIFLVQNGNKNTFLWDMPSNDLRGIGSERNVTTAFKRLVVNAPKIAFLEGNNERSINKTGDEFYKMAVNDPDQGSSLTHIGFDVITVSAHKPIPDSIATLVIADPATPFDETELQQIGQYITKGGNLLITGGKGHQSILKPLLDSFGVHFIDGTVIETGKDSLPADLYANIAPAAIKLSSGYASLIGDSLKVSLPDGAIALEYKNSGNYNITPLLVSNEKSSWNKLGEFKSDTGKIFYNPLAGDNHSSLPVAMALTRQTGTKQQRIMIIGNANFMDNHELSKYSVDQERFLHEIFKWFSYDQFPIDISRPVIYNRIKINYKELGRMKLLLTGLLPLLIFLVGGIFLLLRKRK